MLDIARMDVVLFATADWDAALWTNKQHQARSLRDRGFRVLYVESVGLRPPALRSVVDRARIGRRLKRMFRKPQQVEQGIFVWSPPAIPLQRYVLVRLANRLSMTVLLKLWLWLLSMRPMLIWTYNPLTLQLVSLPCETPLVYHCVDNYAAQDGLPGDTIRAGETQLVKRADVVSVTSRELEDIWSRLRPIHYYPNCVDVLHFDLESATFESRQRNSGRAVVGFVGAIARYKVDVELLLRIFRRRKAWELVLVGPREDDDPDITKLIELDNVVHLPPVSHDKVPEVMRSFSVGIIPATTSDYTKSMFPMKFFEYLASGISIVTTDLPSLREFSDVAAVVPRDNFEATLEKVLSENQPVGSRRKELIEYHSYGARTDAILGVLQSARPEVVLGPATS